MELKQVLTNIARAIVDNPDAVNVVETVDGDDVALNSKFEVNKDQSDAWENQIGELQKRLESHGIEGDNSDIYILMEV